jgi:hypothetical protein
MFSEEVRKEMKAQGFISFEDAAKAYTLSLAQRVAAKAAETKMEEGGDYKDHAAWLSSCLQDQLALLECRRSRRAVATVFSRFNLLDGYNCPRGFLEGWHKFRNLT